MNFEVFYSILKSLSKLLHFFKEFLSILNHSKKNSKIFGSTLKYLETIFKVLKNSKAKLKHIEASFSKIALVYHIEGFLKSSWYFEVSYIILEPLFKKPEAFQSILKHPYIKNAPSSPHLHKQRKNF
jgi:hypothetical protein